MKIEPRVETLTDRLVDGLDRFDLGRVGPDVRERARAHLLDTVGAMMAASAPRYAAGRILRQFVADQGGAPRATVVGLPHRTSTINAAFANGILGYYCDIEPHHTEAVLHPMAVVVPPALAVAESTQARGADLLAAVILGVEVACRTAMALDPRALYHRGFHPTAVAGVFGAAAAAGWLMHLEPREWRSTLGLAALQACGLLAWAGDDTELSRPFNPGIAARGGLTAATMGGLGMGGPADAFEGKGNIFDAFSGVRHPDAIAVDGPHFMIADLATKLYACCAFLHPGLDALLEAMREQNLTIGDITSIDLHFPLTGAPIIDDNRLRSHNAQYILAVAAAHGTVTIDDILTDRRADDPAIARLFTGVRVIHDADLDQGYPQRYSTVLVVHLRDGRVLSRRVDVPKGHPHNPVGTDILTAKFRTLASTAFDEPVLARVMALVDGIEGLADVRELGDALRRQGDGR